MFGKKNSSVLLLTVFFLLWFALHAQTGIDSTHQGSSTGKTIEFTIRLGQGGFSDSRSPIGKLGGGQIALDVKLRKYPIAISLFTEYYTNSADPTHSYEIADLNAVNLLYVMPVTKNERIRLFAGGGFGQCWVPKGEDMPDKMEKGPLYDIELGIHIRAFWKIGFYGIYKYLYARKEVHHVRVIDFNEHIVLLGITFNFSI